MMTGNPCNESFVRVVCEESFDELAGLIGSK